jgi:hypothetical protein
MNDCPHCKTPMDCQTWTLDGWLLEEEYCSCPNCGWFTHDTYGLQDEGFKATEGEVATC